MENIETLRSSLHLSQQEFADLVGCQKINIGQWDSNERSLPSQLILQLIYLTDLLNQAISKKGEVQDTYDYIDVRNIEKLLRKKKHTLINWELKQEKLKAKIMGHKKRLLIAQSTKRNNHDELLELAINLMGRKAVEHLPKLETSLLSIDLKIAALKGEIAYLENNVNIVK